MKVVFNNNEIGDKRLILEENQEGELFLTTNAETQEKVIPRQFLGWPEQREPAAALVWVGELAKQFGNDRKIALRFARKAGAVLPGSDEIKTQMDLIAVRLASAVPPDSIGYANDLQKAETASPAVIHDRLEMLSRYAPALVEEWRAKYQVWMEVQDEVRV